MGVESLQFNRRPPSRANRRTPSPALPLRRGGRKTLRHNGAGPQVRYIEGNPEHPLNKGILCAKGAAGIMKQYSPARLTQPLRRKRGSARGSPPISTRCLFGKRRWRFRPATRPPFRWRR